MRKLINEVIFFAIAAAIILPAPTALLAWMTGQTLTQVLYR